MFGGIYLFMRSYRSSRAVRAAVDRLILRIPVFGSLVEKSIIARWTRTLSTMFAAGVPLVESLSSVGGAAGNVVFSDATEKIRTSVATGSGLTMSMSTTGVFPQMVLQMSAIGEESGTLDQMLSRAADFYEAEVDEMVAGLSSLLEPIIIVFLGTLIGGIVVAMYLPIFKLGDVV
jgi:type IV pilus assembly protein PilC